MIPKRWPVRWPHRAAQAQGRIPGGEFRFVDGTVLHAAAAVGGRAADGGDAENHRVSPDAQKHWAIRGRIGSSLGITVFALIALLQSTVSLGGDLLFLRVQAVHPLLFMLSGWLASLVFSFFTYTMVVSFGNVGKAIGVLMLIVQISGANAAYPVQMLPDFIAKVSPLLPLTHAVTMMRAAIAGIYDMDYWRPPECCWHSCRRYCCLGCCSGKPLVRFNQWYVAQVESTKVLS